MTSPTAIRRARCHARELLACARQLRARRTRLDHRFPLARWTVLALARVLLVLGMMCIPLASRAALPSPRPNFIVILADDLGYGDLGCYGQKRIKTPELDRMAAEGIRFKQAYAGSTVCAPSRDALLTGRHTGHTTLRGNASVPLQPNDVTIAGLLRRTGYTTAAIGKWGLGTNGTSGAPNRRGFDEWFGFLDQTDAHNYYPETLSRNDTALLLPKNLNGATGDYAPDWFMRAATNFVRQNTNNPFFLYLATTIPHANVALGRKTGNGMQVPSDAPYSQEPWPAPERNKAAMITRLDRDVGRLLELVRQLKIDHRTFVFFTSDNGPHRAGGVDPAFFQSSGPFRGLKRDLYEGGIRVPMIAWAPGRIPPGHVTEEIWAAWDLFPTLAAIAGITAPLNTDGRSMEPILTGRGPAKPRGFLYWEFHERGFQQAIRSNDWKALHLTSDQPWELYNLKQDPAEARNVAENHPEIVRQLQAIARQARTTSPHWPISPSKPRPTSASPGAIHTDRN